MYKLDWSKISDEKTFQRLVNHLFAVEYNYTGFLPSSPYIGKDGGWDAYYNNFYQNKKQKSIVSIQSKWTTKNFNAAVKSLKEKIKKELVKACKNNVDNLIIATNAELRNNQILRAQ